ncbi:hypothetical protein [Poseidonibacter antarcticus]|uniref:hypothetical protein n=1 Tax=Poseidonibacter antarcticus TaxID=2478538 RepID=UPI000EF4AAE9|nr:hypothetical protein [Poseidonibacter antarcticus]
MFNLPELLKNPNNKIYNLSEFENYSLKEANELIENEEYEYCLFAIWNAVIINIQRRIEKFGIKNLYIVIDNKDNFNENASTLKDRWINVNEYKTIDYAKNLNIINHITHDIITTLYWMKSNNNEQNHIQIDENEIYAITYLLEKHLFLKEFKIDQRINKTNIQSNFKRREEDRYNDLNLVPLTHQELLLRSKIKVFEKEQNNEESKTPSLIDKYC